jgi:hypothetical protein
MQSLFDQITKAINACTTSPEQDAIILNGKEYQFSQNTFQPITEKDKASITFIDGGSATLLSAPNFSLHFIRIYACTFKNNKKTGQHKNEFYLLSTSTGGHDISYETEIFQIKGEQLIHNLKLNSHDPTIRTGKERAEITQLANVARRFAEIKLASKLSNQSDFILLDGTLDAAFTNEQSLLDALPDNVVSLAKTTNIFTIKGNSAAAILNDKGPSTAWNYTLTKKERKTTMFVKLNPRSEYVFRLETLSDKPILPTLASHATDPVFLGYPYGLIWADKLARISNHETAMLKTHFMVKLGKNALKIKKYLNAANAHEVLDSIG